MYFRNYGLRKTLLEKCLKSVVSQYPSTSNMVKTPKHCSNLNGGTFAKFIDHFESNWLWKSLLVIWKILRLFVNTFTADDRYSLPNRSNLTQLIQMILSLREKSFVNFFSGVLKYRLNFEHFQIKEMTRNQFRCNYQKDKKLFLNFFLRFWNVDELLNI